MAAIPPGTGTVFNPAQQAIDSFRLQIDEHERLRHAHERLRHEHEHAMRRASESEQALSEAVLSEARSKELARSLQATVEKYVATCSLRASVDESTSQGAQRPPPPSSPNTLLERRVRELAIVAATEPSGQNAQGRTASALNLDSPPGMQVPPAPIEREPQPRRGNGLG